MVVWDTLYPAKYGSVSISRVSPMSDLAGFGASPKPMLAPRLATSSLHCRSVEASLLPSDLDVKSCKTLMQHEIFVSGGLEEEGGAERGRFLHQRGTFFCPVFVQLTRGLCK